MVDNWTVVLWEDVLLKLFAEENMGGSWHGSNPEPFDGQWDALSNNLFVWIEVISEGYISAQPVTFWWPVRCSNHWAIWTEMMSEGYICVQPGTFWPPVRFSNHWVTWTKMMSEGYTCVQPVTFWWPVKCSNAEMLYLSTVILQSQINIWFTQAPSTLVIQINLRSI